MIENEFSTIFFGCILSLARKAPLYYIFLQVISDTDKSKSPLTESNTRQTVQGAVTVCESPLTKHVFEQKAIPYA